MEILGAQTKSIFLKGIEMHKLHHEFEVAAGATIKKGQPVKLNADGEVVSAAIDELAKDVIGYSIHNGTAGQHVTVGMKAMAITWAMPNLALSAGAVAFDGMNGEDGNYCSYKTAGADGTKLVGWAIDAATGPDETIRVAVV